MLIFKIIFRSILITITILLIGERFFPVEADIYIYVDEQGIFHFTNTPTSSKYRVYIKETPETVLSAKISNKYDEFISKAADHYQLPFSLLKAIIKVESDFDPFAVSRKGAQGLMQIMPDNQIELQIKNAFDPAENIMAGTRYLKYLLEKFNKNITLALAAYNAGPSVVEKHGRIPPIEETIVYVDKVMKYYQLLKLEEG